MILKIIGIITLIIIILLDSHNRKERKKSLKIAYKKSDKVKEEIVSQFSKDTLNYKEKFIETFSLNTKPFSDVPEHIKRQVIEDNTDTIKGLDDEDKYIIAQKVYDCIINGNASIELRNLIYDNFKIKLNLKYKKEADLIARQQINKAHCKLYRIELLHNNIKKVKWCYIGGTCNIEKHKIYSQNKAVFSLGTGLYDEELKKYIFPTDLENCDCIFFPIVEE